MEFKDKLMMLRKEKNVSQEELGAAINVTRQTISNWEGGISSPDLEKVKALALYFDVSCDELIGFKESEPKNVSVINNYYFGYEYKSKKMLFGLPLLHVNVGFGLKRAKGIIAIGNIATGLISIGGISIGLLSLGVLSLGLISLGVFALAILIAAGSFALGTIAFGALAIGVISFGGIAIGIYSIGGMAVAKEIAYGGLARGKVAFNLENGSKEYTKEEIKMLIELYAPKTIWIIKQIFIALGK